MKWNKLITGTFVLALMAGLIAPHSAAGAGPAGAPGLVHYTDDGVKVLSLEGSELASFGAGYQFISLDGSVFAGSRHRTGERRGELIEAVDVTTGDHLFRIKNAFAPVAVDGGRKIGFLPDRWGRRDPYFASVWVRNAQGRERRIVQFKGPERTVPRTGLGDGAPMDLAFDAEGRTAAVTFGFDGGDGSVDLLRYDVWVVDVKTRKATRMTTGQKSRWPSLSPNGERLAVAREVDRCGGGYPGYRASHLRVMDTTGENKVTLLTGTCDLYYTDPRWISDDRLVAARLTRVGPGQYDVDLVQIDAATGETTELVTGGDVVFFTVSASLQKISYALRNEPTGFFVYDLATGESTAYPEGYIPQLAGVHRQV